MRFRPSASLLTLLLATSAALADGPDPEFTSAAAINDLGTVDIHATRIEGPGLAVDGTADYRMSAEGIDALPAGAGTPVTSILAQMPSVAIDQNQQIHIRNTEGPQFQYQINGFLVPIDINTNPPFLSMLGSEFIERLDLKVGVLPARYGYATGGVVDLVTKDGCQAPGGVVSLEAGQRATVSPSLEVGSCDGPLSSFVSARYTSSNTAFSSATPGPTPLHDGQEAAQVLGFWSYALSPSTRASLLVSGNGSDNELPNVANLAPAYALAGVPSAPNSGSIDSRLNFRDALVMANVVSSPTADLELRLGASLHYIEQAFDPDPAGELIYQGVASLATHVDHDLTLEGGVRYALGAHALDAGFYVGRYSVTASDDSLVFPAAADGSQTSFVPVHVVTATSAVNQLRSLYLDDTWQVTERLSASGGLRADELSGYTSTSHLSPRLNLLFRISPEAAIHAGAAHFLQVPSLLGISPSTQASFAGTTAAGPPGEPLPLAENDTLYDAGIVLHPLPSLTVSLDSYYERTDHYLDTGQFGVVPIFAPFNYDRGHVWGTEFATRYEANGLAAYLNVTTGKNWQQGVATGQFNFPADELAYIGSHEILLDHQPVLGASAGLSYRRGACAVGIDGLYSSGLATGFADTGTLPHVVEFNVNAERSWSLGRVPLVARLTVLNLLDRVNEIRSMEGIGIFQAAYDPRRTLLVSLSARF